MRDTSDRLCREYDLSIITRPHKAPSRPVWLDEKSGKPTRYNVYRKDIREAFANSVNMSDAEQYLQRLGYITDFSGKHWKIRLPQYQHFTRLDTLDEEWTPTYWEQHVGSRAYYGSKEAIVDYTPYMPRSYDKYYTPFRYTRYIRNLYVYFCYELGIFPETQYYQPTSPYLKQELRKLDQYTAELDYMDRHCVNTLDDLYFDRQDLEGRLDDLTAQRTKLQNKIRRAAPEDKTSLRKQKSLLTAEISKLRKYLKCNYAIEAHSKHIQETLDRVTANEARADGYEVPQQTIYEENNMTHKKKERNYER